MADPFVFNTQSNPPFVLLGLRQLGTSSELIANLGKVDTYSKATPGSSILVTNLTAAEITTVFPSLDDLQVDIFASVFAALPGLTNKTLWLVNPRDDINTQTLPLIRKPSNSQALVASRIATIGNNAANVSSGEPAGPNNTTTWVVLPSDLSYGYTAIIGPNGTFGGNFAVDTETTLPNGFATGGVVARMDFYQLVPSVTGQSNQGTYLGYFEFGTDATLSFHAAGGVTNSPPPQITGITRDNSLNTITFATLAGGYKYTLLRAPSAGLEAPIAQWTPVGSSVTGTGNPVSLTDTADDAGGFYRVQVLP